MPHECVIIVRGERDDARTISERLAASEATLLDAGADIEDEDLYYLATGRSSPRSERSSATTGGAG